MQFGCSSGCGNMGEKMSKKFGRLDVAKEDERLGHRWCTVVRDHALPQNSTLHRSLSCRSGPVQRIPTLAQAELNPPTRVTHTGIALKFRQQPPKEHINLVEYGFPVLLC